MAGARRTERRVLTSAHPLAFSTNLSSSHSPKLVQLLLGGPHFMSFSNTLSSSRPLTLGVVMTPEVAHLWVTHLFGPLTLPTIHTIFLH